MNVSLKVLLSGNTTRQTYVSAVSSEMVKLTGTHTSLSSVKFRSASSCDPFNMATSMPPWHVNTLHANERVSPTDLSEISMSAIASMKTSAGGK